MEALIFASVFTAVFGGLYWKFKQWLTKPPEPIDEHEPTSREIRESPEYRAWVSSVKKRDVWCIFCHSTENLEAHHIYSFASFPELRFDVTNGITLCQKCHKLTPNYGSKEKSFSQRIINLK